MTLEDVSDSSDKMEQVSRALEEVLVSARLHECLTVGVYESAKLMNADPDSVRLCVLAADEEDEDDVALQIHFTLLQAFCRDYDVNIVRLAAVSRLAQLIQDDESEPRDLHCILVTSPPVQPLQCPALHDVISFCEDSRCRNQWVPLVALMDR
ncbi:growth arrest and DNA damage-inducible protein GADD45 beta-like [Dunckerocampus dactyliophorus]|uniref:growth arrest and DNA damage-inducible protein GADD45 beta-like n=1 Tax=Dunckerocampus dactyliophorus TaxID=161453 RepID=UPI0024070DB2|nr:growth arrest and DNA damage-inducible protein GADD45 beta-like [Dunckerocampus dactyliophorus]